MRPADPDHSLPPAPFIYALTASTLLVLSAPFIGEARRWLRLSFPTHFVTIVGAATAVAALLAVAIAVSRIRQHRTTRYALMVAAALLAIGYSRWSAIGNPESDVVEHVHFIEYGLVTLLFYRAWRPLGDAGVLLLPLFAGIAVGTCEEWLQWFIPARVGEMRDIFLNCAAIVSGLLFSAAVLPPIGAVRQLRPRSLVHLCVVAAIATTLFTAFLTCVHLGYEIADRDIGRFSSIYDAAGLRTLADARAREWLAAPPVVRPPRLSREDQYMSEGLLHVQERNRQWDAGNVTPAWFENLILEGYFAPVLDTPSYVSRTGHRWPAAQRAEADRRAAHDPAVFVSAAQGAFPIFTWRRSVVWSFSSALVGALSIAALLIKRAAGSVSDRSHAPGFGL